MITISHENQQNVRFLITIGLALRTLLFNLLINQSESNYTSRHCLAANRIVCLFNQDHDRDLYWRNAVNFIRINIADQIEPRSADPQAS